MNKDLQKIINTIKIVPNFPKKGISFKDITPILLNPDILKLVILKMIKTIQGQKFDVVLGLESRGFWFGVLIAQALNLPFVPVRKKGKLPRATISASYTLEYGKDFLELHKDDVKMNQRILIVDDIVATGGTVLAVKNIVKKLKVKSIDLLVLGYLAELPEGVKKLSKAGIKVHSLLKL